jgi:sugar phosphate isomerase/epimerase
MKLSCLPVSFFSEILDGRMSIKDWARMGALLGLDAIDLSVLFVKGCSPNELAKIRQEIEGEGMRVAMITSYPDFTHPKLRQRQKELVMEQEVVEIAAALGAELVRVTAGQSHPETGRVDGIEWAVEGLTALVETTRDSGVKLVYENHARPGVWQYTDFSQPPDIFMEIFRLTEAVSLGVNFDMGNAATFAKDPLAFLNMVIPRIVSIHASDSAMKGELRHVLLGTGITPYPEMFACLKNTGWDGWICMEEASQLGRQGVETATKFIRKTWEKAGVPCNS